MPRGDGLVHGTLGGYTNYRCRCQPCRDAYAAYSRDWRRRNPERSREIQRRASRSPRRVASRRAWRDRNRERVRAVERTRLYGLSPSEFEAMLEAQGGVCAICERPNSDGRSLHVDHDHETEAVRGLLCAQCNAGLGIFGDSPELVRRALAYLDQSSQIL